MEKEDLKRKISELFRIRSCLESEEEGGLIINEVMDGASSEINELYDRLFDIGYGRGEKV